MVFHEKRQRQADGPREQKIVEYYEYLAKFLLSDGYWQIKPEELAHRFGVTPRTILRWNNKGLQAGLLDYREEWLNDEHTRSLTFLRATPQMASRHNISWNNIPDVKPGKMSDITTITSKKNIPSQQYASVEELLAESYRRYQLSGTDPLRELLEHHFGQGPVYYATGYEHNPHKGKYMPLRTQRKPHFSFDRYLRGEKMCLYATAPLLESGLTYIMTDDVDAWELHIAHRSIQEQLADMGVSTVYFKRRPGRGHLLTRFNRPVDPDAAHRMLVSICPRLAVCECFPRPSQPKSWVSWPLYYKVRSVVRECEVVAVFGGFSESPVVSEGVQSDRLLTAQIVAAAINDVSIVPEKAPASITGDRLRSRPLTHSNRPTTYEDLRGLYKVTDVLEMEVGDWFKYRDEEHASAVVRSETLVVDFTPDGPKSHDVTDCYAWKHKISRGEAFKILCDRGNDGHERVYGIC